MTKSSYVPRMDNNELSKILGTPVKGDEKLFELIVDTPFQFEAEAAFLFLGIDVLLLVNKKTGMIDRVAISNTELATNTNNVSFVPFKDIKIPMAYPDNIISQAIQTGKPQETTDWKQLYAPALTTDQAHINQASSGIAYSAVYPLQARDGGAMIFSFYQYSSNIGVPQKNFMKTYTSLVNERLNKS